MAVRGIHAMAEKSGCLSNETNKVFRNGGIALPGSREKAPRNKPKDGGSEEKGAWNVERATLFLHGGVRGRAEE